MKIIKVLLVALCCIVVIQMFANELPTSEEKRILVPVKIVNNESDNSSETTIKYDRLLRITNIKTVFFGTDSTVKYTIERIVSYDDLSQQYRAGGAYIVDSIAVVIINKNLRNPMLTMGYKFNYNRVSPVEYEIEASDGHSVTNYSVDAKSGLLLESKSCKSSDNEACLSIAFSYDTNGNITKKTYKQGVLQAFNILNTYDDKPGVFSNTATPQWIFYEYLSPISSFGLKNNIVSQISDDECKVNVKGVYIYNSDGYPIKYVTNTYLSATKSALCLYPDNLDYTIEYELVDDLSTK